MLRAREVVVQAAGFAQAEGSSPQEVPKVAINRVYLDTTPPYCWFVMSTNSADLSTSFSPEEWTLLKSAPLLAGLSVTLADLRSGIFGAIKEGLAPSQAIIEAGQGASNPVVASVVASIKEMAAKRERLQPPISVSGKKPEELKTEVAAQLAKISGILEGKVPAEQAEGFKNWLVSIAGKVANAATEGGFFGIGGEKVSAAETAAINELASSLGVKA